MTGANIRKTLDLALQNHRTGRLREAERLYRKILAADPRNPNALHYLGVLAAQAGQHDLAVDLIRQSISLKPNAAAAYSDLGNLLKEKRRLDEAITAYRQAIAIRPNFAEAHYNLGNVLLEKGQLDEAIAAYRQAIALNPTAAPAHGNLGNALKEKGLLDEAIAAFRQTIALSPNSPGAYNNLGLVLKSRGQIDDAIAAFGKAISVNAKFAQAYGNLGAALKDKGEFHEAIAAYRQSIACNPNDAGSYVRLGDVLKESGYLDAAIAAYRHAIALRPNYPEAEFNLASAFSDKDDVDNAADGFERALALRSDWPEAQNNLGNALRDRGQLDQAVGCYREAIRLNPRLAGAHSNLINTLHFHPGYDARMIHAEHLSWQRQHAEPLKMFIQPHENKRDPERRLRIGYVSADFYRHVLARAFLQLLQNHDREKFEVFCYASVKRPDETTQRLRLASDHWQDIADVADDAAARLVRQDRIDILIDLDLHTADNRLLLFARKSAPIQATYLGYSGGTGLAAIDYRFSDRYIDPPDADLSVYSEQTIRLPDCYWCYQPPEQCPEVSPAPAQKSGLVTFGSMNKFAKVSSRCLELWARVLTMIPQSRLIIHARRSNRLDTIHQLFGRTGIDPDRLEFIGFQPLPDYLRTFARIDIALDSYPCNGGITTCDSMWMGVPVVSLAGQTSVGRAGCSILNSVGLPNLVATTEEEYLRIASGLAGDINRLIDLRMKLRPIMQRSPLLDGPRQTRNIEAAYREVWQSYCSRNA
jgi:protein O-GlcNAc transferase